MSFAATALVISDIVSGEISNCPWPKPLSASRFGLKSVGLPLVLAR